MTIRQASLLVVAVLAGTLLMPIGYGLAVITLSAVAAYGFYTAAVRLSARFSWRISDRVFAGIAVGACLIVFAAYAEFARRVSP